MPKISYLIVTKNRADEIKRAIESLITQSIPDWEAIIVDDHGDDKTGKVVNDFNDPRLHYFKLRESDPSGISNARNYGAPKTEAPIIAVLDSDDVCYPNRTKVTLDAFAASPDADIFYANIDVYEEETGILRDRKTPFIEYSLERLKQGNFITHSTIAAKREIFLKFSYNPHYKIAEDYEFYTRVAAANKKFIFSPEKVVKYYVHAGNISMGEKRAELGLLYVKLAQIERGWTAMDVKITDKIAELEKELGME